MACAFCQKCNVWRDGCWTIHPPEGARHLHFLSDIRPAFWCLQFSKSFSKSCAFTFSLCFCFLVWATLPPVVHNGSVTDRNSQTISAKYRQKAFRWNRKPKHDQLLSFSGTVFSRRLIHSWFFFKWFFTVYSNLLRIYWILLNNRWAVLDKTALCTHQMPISHFSVLFLAIFGMFRSLMCENQTLRARKTPNIIHN